MEILTFISKNMSVPILFFSENTLKRKKIPPNCYCIMPKKVKYFCINIQVINDNGMVYLRKYFCTDSQIAKFKSLLLFRQKFIFQKYTNILFIEEDFKVIVLSNIYISHNDWHIAATNYI